MVTHRALLNHVWWRRDFMGMNAEDRLLQKTSLNFDVSVWKIFGPLSAGARFGHGLPDEADSGRGVTTMSLVPSQMRSLLNDPGISDCQSLRVVNCGGEIMPTDLPELLFTHLQSRFYNGYGPTETTVGVIYWECRKGDERAIIPIGRPMANTRVFVLARHRNPVPIGVTGEIYLGGASLARGYLNRPELTRERFVPNPFCGNPGETLYRTGDLGRYRSDGNLEFLGRMDRQVKLRGMRIELGEIEALLLRMNGVREAVALVREDTPGDQRLVAYVTGEKGSSLDGRHLRNALGNHLRAAMVPGLVVTLQQLPLTPNGKLDQKALAVPVSGHSEDDPGSLALRSPVEEKLAAIWKEVLKVGKIGIRDNFFELGGHSLHAIRVRNRIEAVFQVTLPVRDLFDDSTIERLARKIEAKSNQVTSGEGKRI